MYMTQDHAIGDLGSLHSPACKHAAVVLEFKLFVQSNVKRKSSRSTVSADKQSVNA